MDKDEYKKKSKRLSELTLLDPAPNSNEGRELNKLVEELLAHEMAAPEMNGASFA